MLAIADIISGSLYIHFWFVCINICYVSEGKLKIMNKFLINKLYKRM